MRAIHYERVHACESKRRARPAADTPGGCLAVARYKYSSDHAGWHITAS